MIFIFSNHVCSSKAVGGAWVEIFDYVIIFTMFLFKSTLPYFKLPLMQYSGCIVLIIFILQKGVSVDKFFGRLPLKAKHH